MPRHRTAAAAVALTFALAGLSVVASRRAARIAGLPDSRLTPGAVLPGVTVAQTCDPAWTHRSRKVSDSLRRAIFRRDLGRDPTAADRAAFECDHRCPVSLGGESSARNLWAQPWGGKWGARTKDRLENLIYKKVCKGELTLGQAQGIFLGDWTVAYIKYLGNPADHKVGGAVPGEDESDHDNEGFPR